MKDVHHVFGAPKFEANASVAKRRRHRRTEGTAAQGRSDRRHHTVVRHHTKEAHERIWYAEHECMD